MFILHGATNHLGTSRAVPVISVVSKSTLALLVSVIVAFVVGVDFKITGGEIIEDKVQCAVEKI